VRKGEILPASGAEPLKFLNCGRNIVQREKNGSESAAELGIIEPKSLKNDLGELCLGRYCDRGID
jgi:hypothetical protein